MYSSLIISDPSTSEHFPGYVVGSFHVFSYFKMATLIDILHCELLSGKVCDPLNVSSIF